MRPPILEGSICPSPSTLTTMSAPSASARLYPEHTAPPTPRLLSCCIIVARGSAICRTTSTVRSRLPSSTTITEATSDGILAMTLAMCCDSLYAGMTTTICCVIPAYLSYHLCVACRSWEMGQRPPNAPNHFQGKCQSLVEAWLRTVQPDLHSPHCSRTVVCQ